jgi:hypothetical protein
MQSNQHTLRRRHAHANQVEGYSNNRVQVKRLVALQDGPFRRNAVTASPWLLEA